MKMLRILSCSDPHKWYANKIGELVPFVDDNDIFFSEDGPIELGEWKSLQDVGICEGHRFVNFVKKTDAEIIEV